MGAIHTGSKQGAKSETRSQKVEDKGLKIHQRRTFGLEGHLVFTGRETTSTAGGTGGECGWHIDRDGARAKSTSTTGDWD